MPNFKAIGQLFMDILHLKTLGMQKVSSRMQLYLHIILYVLMCYILI